MVLLLPGVLHKAGRVFNPLQSRLRSFLAPKANS